MAQGNGDAPLPPPQALLAMEARLLPSGASGSRRSARRWRGWRTRGLVHRARDLVQSLTTAGACMLLVLWYSCMPLLSGTAPHYCVCWCCMPCGAMPCGTAVGRTPYWLSLMLRHVRYPSAHSAVLTCHTCVQAGSGIARRVSGTFKRLTFKKKETDGEDCASPLGGAAIEEDQEEEEGLQDEGPGTPRSRSGGTMPHYCVCYELVCAVRRSGRGACAACCGHTGCLACYAVSGTGVLVRLSAPRAECGTDEGSLRAGNGIVSRVSGSFKRMSLTGFRKKSLDHIDISAE
eukprot:2865826-Rhodomonas_salina.1